MLRWDGCKQGLKFAGNCKYPRTESGWLSLGERMLPVRLIPDHIRPQLAAKISPDYDIKSPHPIPDFLYERNFTGMFHKDTLLRVLTSLIANYYPKQFFSSFLVNDTHIY